ncbi:hypothetical protein HBI52_214250 [Parastagonospora nodorum]|nr:hypothetical protein HBI52_214250 [Parastagonospora nodorum]
MLQTNIREEYRITTLEVIKLIEDLISYLIVAKYTQLRNAQILKVFYKAASLSIVSNRSIALITNKFSVASLTKLAILNNANVALVDAVHYSIQKLEKNYFEVRAQHLKYNVIDALIITLIKDNDDLLGTVNSYIKLRRLRARRKTKAADSRYAKASRERTKKDKDLEDSNTSSDVPRLCKKNRAAACAQLAKRKQLEKKAQLKKTRDEEKLAKAKKEKEEKELTDAYILYFKELLSNNSGIFANAIGIEVQNAQAEGNAIEHNAVNNNDKLYSTEGERTFYCANSPLENISRLTKEKAIEMQINTTNAISKALAAANKLFIIVCSFRKVDKHVFRAYNTISVIAQQTIIRKGGSYIEKKAILLLNILEKEGLNKLEASRRFKTYSSCKVKRFTLNSVKDLFTNLSKDYFLSITAEDAAKAANILLLLKEVCAKILIESYKLIVQAVTWLGLREKFSDKSVLVMQRALIAFAEAITLTEATHVVIIELQDSIVYFNLDSKLELKVLGKQDVKITS